MPVKKTAAKRKTPSKRRNKGRSKRKKIAPWRNVLRILLISIVSFIMLVYLLVFLKARFL